MKKFSNRSRKPFIRKNEYIRIPEIRLIGSDGYMLGITSTNQALMQAREQGLDLVEIAPQAKPPVCKILDYSKYIYELKKEKRQQKKKQKDTGELKEIRFKVRIGKHDLDTKIAHTRKFLEKKDKVRLTVIFRGRENQHRDLGRDLLTSMVEQLKDLSKMEGGIQMQGNRMSVNLSPK